MGNVEAKLTYIEKQNFEFDPFCVILSIKCIQIVCGGPNLVRPWFYNFFYKKILLFVSNKQQSFVNWFENGFQENCGNVNHFFVSYFKEMHKQNNFGRKKRRKNELKRNEKIMGTQQTIIIIYVDRAATGLASWLRLIGVSNQKNLFFLIKKMVFVVENQHSSLHWLACYFSFQLNLFFQFILSLFYLLT